jgi:pantetheine-phosphate adenylyltransferase
MRELDGIYHALHGEVARQKRPEGLRRSAFAFLPSLFFLGSGNLAVKLLPMRTVIYPGSFDPMTNGHLDVLQRAAKLFDRVIVAVAKNDSKHPLFTFEERLDLARRSTRHMSGVEVDGFESLLVDYVKERAAQAIVRGLRAVSDFEYEFQLALMNRKLNEQFETIFMTPKETYTFLSSTMVKEIARLGGDVSAFVPAQVQKALARKFAGRPA